MGGMSSSGGMDSGMGGGKGGNDSGCDEGCDDDNDCTEDTCIEGECAHTTVEAGEECSGGVCNGVTSASRCVRCIDDRAGDNQDAGCSAGAPECRTTGTPTCTGCSSHDDCDDNNDCTEDTCSPSGECTTAALDAGAECSEGICNGVLGEEACATCFDDQAGKGRDTGCDMTSPICDEEGDGTCHSCLDSASGDAVDLGCSDDAPFCSGQSCGACVDDKSGVETDSGCNDSTPVCDAGTCVECTSHTQCSGGTTCDPFRCQAGSCVQVDVRQVVTLIDGSTLDGGFETGEANGSPWDETGNFQIIFECSPLGEDDGCSGVYGDFYTPTGNYLAWLGGVDDEIGSIYQPVPLPSGIQTLRLRADTNFMTLDSPVSTYDFMTINLKNMSGGTLLTLDSFSNEDAQESPANVWTTNGIDKTYPVSALGGQTVNFSLDYKTDPTLATDFLVDNLRLTATVCE